MMRLRPTFRCGFLLPLVAGLLISAAGCKDKTSSVRPPINQPAEGVPLPAGGDAPAVKASAMPTIAEPPFTPRLAAVLALAVSVRSAPKSTASEVGRIHCGDIVQLTTREGDWYQLQLGELSGYAHSAYLIEIKSGSGMMPACEAERLGTNLKKDPKPIKLPTHPTANKALTKKLLAKANEKPVPDAVPALSQTKEDQEESASKAEKPAPAEKTDKPKEGDKAEPAAKPEKAAKAEKSKKAPQNLQLSTAGIKAPVSFPHMMHTKVTGCVKCHHPLSGESGANKDKRCHDCHAPGGKGDSSVSNKDAFHRNCRDCHNTMGQGPTTCAECHVKP